jgi:hypothetical protein
MHYLLMTCALGEVFLLWFLAGLIREIRRHAPRTWKGDRTGRGRASRREGPILTMNSGTTQEETTEKTLGQRIALMATDALPFTFPLHGQQR